MKWRHPGRLCGALLMLLAASMPCRAASGPDEPAAAPTNPSTTDRATPCLSSPSVRGTGDLGIVIERATGSVLIVEHSGRTTLGRVTGLGDLSHAHAVFSRDARYAYVFGRDGGLTKVDLLRRCIERRIVQAGNSIGGSISQDGRVVAAQNYEPGGIRLFDAGTLEPLSEIPATTLAATDGSSARRSKVVGLADLPGARFAAALYDTGEIWIVDASDPRKPRVQKFSDAGRHPYDGLASPDGRHFIAGLFDDDGLALLDTWEEPMKVRRILPGYRKEDPRLPVFKMPHLRGWSMTRDQAFLPAIGAHRVLVADTHDWHDAGSIDVAGQPVFVVARPDGRQLWVNFALPDNGRVQVIDVPTRRVIRTLEPCRGVLHFEFTPRGDEVWLSCRDDGRVEVWDTATLERRATLPAEHPSGIFFTSRAGRIGL